MTLNKRKKWKRLVLTGLFFLFVIVLCFVFSCYSMEKSRHYVPMFKTEDKVIFLYRDDCMDCKRIFPYIYARNLLTRDTIFVNLNQELNRKVYLRKYHVVSVPTFVKGNKSYSGTSVKDIHVLYSK